MDSPTAYTQAKKESSFKAKAYLLQDVLILPGEQVTAMAQVPNFERRGQNLYNFEPFIISDVMIKPAADLRFISRTNFYITLINKLTAPVKLVAHVPVGHVLKVNQQPPKESKYEKETSDQNKKNIIETTQANVLKKVQVNDELQKRPVIVVGDTRVKLIKHLLEKELGNIAELQIAYSSDANLGKALDLLECMADKKNKDTIAIVIAGSNDFHEHYESQTYATIVNNLPLGRLRDFSEKFHVLYTPIFPRYDVRRINAKIDLVNASILGQIVNCPRLSRININKELLPCNTFEQNGTNLNEKGKQLVTKAIVDAVRAITQGDGEIGVVNAIENGHSSKLNCRRPLHVKGTVNFKEISFVCDTGAGVSLCRPELVNKDDIKPVRNFQLLTAASEELRPLGEAKLEFELDGEPFVQDVFVSDQLPEPIILGVNFLEFYNCLIDFDLQRLTLRRNVSREIHLHFNQNNSSSQQKSLILNSDDYESTVISFCNIANATCVPPPPLAKVRHPVTIKGNQIAKVPIYFTKNLTSPLIALKQINKGKVKKIDILTSTFDPNKTDEIQIRNDSPHSIILFQDSTIGKVQENYIPPTRHENIPAAHIKNLNSLNINPNLTPDERRKVIEGIADYHDVFLWDESKFKGGMANYPPVSIPLTSDKIVYKPPYRLSTKEAIWLEKEVQNLKSQNILEDSDSSYGFPAILIPKNDTFRLVQDYRLLNAMVRKKNHPLPILEQCLMSCSGMKYVSILDCKHGFWNIRLHPDSRDVTSFSCVQHLRYAVLPQGYINSPAEFQTMIDKMISGLKYTHGIGYLDDILSWATSVNSMINTLRRFLERIRKMNLKLNVRKAQICCQELDIFGYRLTKNGLEVDPTKCQGILEYPTPTSIKGVRRFVGLITYYRRFIKNASILCKPLYDIIKNPQGQFTWTKEADEAFKLLKNRLTSPPVLAHFDPDLEIQIEVDSCKIGVGAVLALIFPDGPKPVCYFSQLFTPVEMRYGSSEIELNGLVKTLEKWRTYIWGRKVKIITDHAPLRQHTTIQNFSNRLARLSLRLSNYQLEVVHKSGKLHTNCDALSREIKGADELKCLAATELSFKNESPCIICEAITKYSLRHDEPGEINLVLSLSPVDLTTMQKEDPEFDPIFQALKDPDKVSNKIKRLSRQFFISDQGTLYKKVYGAQGRDRIMCVPRKMRPEILKKYHDDFQTAHPGQYKTLEILKPRFYWKTMHKDIKNYVLSCVTCQMTKPNNKLPAGLRSSKTVEPYPWRHVSIDAAGPFRLSNGKRYILAAVCHFTKYIFAETTARNTADAVAKFLFKLYCLFGPVAHLHSDLGTSFMAEAVQNFLLQIGCTSKQNTSYNPSTTGMIETRFKFIKTILKQYVNTAQRDWADYVPIAVAALNRTVSVSTNYSPYELLFGVPPTFPSDFGLQVAPNGVPLDERLTRLAEIRREALTAILKAQTTQIKNANKKRREVDLEIGSEVLVFMPQIKPGLMKKLCIQYRGPYTIVRKINQSIYEINFGTKNKPKLKKIQAERLRLYKNPATYRANIYNINVLQKPNRASRHIYCCRVKRLTRKVSGKRGYSKNATSEKTSIMTLDTCAPKVTLEPYPVPQSITSLVNNLPLPPPAVTQEQQMTDDAYKNIFKERKPNSEVLTPNNYKNRFHLQLFLEEIQAARALKAYKLRNVAILEDAESSVICVSAPHDESSQIQLGDKLRVTLLKTPESNHYGTIRSFHDGLMEITLPPSFFFDYKKGDMANISFLQNRYPFKVAHRGIDSAQDFFEKTLFPRKLPKIPKNFSDPIQYIKPEIENNPQQLQVIQSVLRISSSVPLIIFGPPGTGKSSVILETLRLLWGERHKRSLKVLICAPSNSVIDSIVMKLLEIVPAEEILRIYPCNKCKSSIPDSILQEKCFNCGRDNEIITFKLDQLQNPTFIASTLIGVGKLVSAGLGKTPHFSHIFIDEICQSNEPEALIPICGLAHTMNNPTRIILAGDPFQLGPIVTSDWAKKFGLGISLMERLMKLPIYKRNVATNSYNPAVVVKLVQNFRSHPYLFKFSNEMFYSNELISKGPLNLINLAIGSNILPNSHVPLIFCNVRGEEFHESNSMSYYNPTEVNTVIKYVTLLMHPPGLNNRQITEEEIGIITPYRSQVMHLKTRLQNLNLSKIQVGTIESFQGMEKLCTIITTVRSKKSNKRSSVGFLKCSRRLNTALTRAICLTILIGNSEVLATNDTWRSLLQQCKDDGVWTDELSVQTPIKQRLRPKKS